MGGEAAGTCPGPNHLDHRPLAELVMEFTRSTSRIVHRPLPQDDPTQRCPDITLARQSLGWEPRVPLEQGLGRTIAYFRQLMNVQPRVVLSSTCR